MRNHSLAPSRALISLVVAIGLLAGTVAMAGTVYRWKDANGQSHYSQQPPDGVKKYETITSSGNAGATDDDSAAAPATAAASGKKDNGSAGGMTPAQEQRQKNCKAARDNQTTLTQHATVNADVNGDGKLVTLNAAQHDQMLAEAKKQVDLYCSQ